ncbi:MAG: hypothetical protein ACWA6U_00475 [Breznakibacter sp.]
MHYSRYKISDFVDLVSSLMEVATNDLTIREAMAEVGYSAQKLDEGEQLYQDLMALSGQHEALTKQKKQVNAQRNQLYLSLKKAYMRAVKIARIAFQDHEDVLIDLALDLEREKNMDVWMGQGQLFCQKLLADSNHLAFLLGFGISRDAMESLVAQFEELKNTSTIKVSVDERLLLLTKNKKAAMVRFQRWLSDYVKMARIRFDEDPEMLILLNIKP